MERRRERSSSVRAAAWVAGVVLAAALASPACTTSSVTTTARCALNSDCATGLVCALGPCRPPCVSASDCPVPGSSCIDDGRSAFCETPAQKNTPCTSEAQCAVPLACASDYRCRNLCINDADCNVLGIVGRVCARDMNGVDYCADPNEVTNGVITIAPPPGAPSTPVIEPDAGKGAIATTAPSTDLIATEIGPGGGTVGVDGVTVIIPAGALSADLNITIQLSGQPGPNGTVSPVFEIGPTGTIFALPATVAFDYTDSEVAGQSPNVFAVETSAAGLGAWTPLSNIVVDVYAHTIAGQTMHLSPYALVNEQLQQGSGPDASGMQADGGQGSTPDGGVDATSCTNTCTVGSTQCAPEGVQTCQMQAGGCGQWVTTTACGAHQACSTAAGAAAAPTCTCNASSCMAVGTVCQDAQTVATCAKDDNGCFYPASTSPCTTPMSCSGAAPTAGCALSCTNSCTQGQTSCVAGGLATCTLGSNGCWAYAAPVACGSRQTCTGAAGAAACTCNADPVCTTAAPTCASSTSLATCSTDAQGCVYASAVSTCTSCVAGVCCTSSCAQGQTMCVGSELATCTLVSNGCWGYGTPAACVGAHQSCSGAAGVATCACTASPYCTMGPTGGPSASCVDNMTLALCSIDGQGCPYETGTQGCTNGACYSGSCCTNVCTAGEQRCVPPAIETCSVGVDGCLEYVVTSPKGCG
jgi:hypothetical protein